VTVPAVAIVAVLWLGFAGSWNPKSNALTLAVEGSAAVSAWA
jgi:hypothetical protein